MTDPPRGAPGWLGWMIIASAVAYGLLIAWAVKSLITWAL